MRPFNWAGVVAAIVVAEALGFLWYGPLFGEHWALLMGRPGESVISSGNTDMAFGVIATALWVCGLAWMASRIGTSGWGAGARMGAVAWLLFAMPIQSFAFTYAGHSDKLMPIEMGYTFVAFIVSGALVAGLSLKPRGEAATNGGF